MFPQSFFHFIYHSSMVISFFNHCLFALTSDHCFANFGISLPSQFQNSFLFQNVPSYLHYSINWSFSHLLPKILSECYVLDHFSLSCYTWYLLSIHFHLPHLHLRITTTHFKRWHRYRSALAKCTSICQRVSYSSLVSRLLHQPGVGFALLGIE